MFLILHQLGGLHNSWDSLSAFCVRIVNAASGSPGSSRYSPAMYMTGPSGVMACLILRLPCACHSK